MVGVKNKNESWKTNYINIMRLLVLQTQKLGLTPVLLNHEGNGDREICQTLNSYFNNEIELIEEADPLKVKGIIGASKAIVCSRFHGCVSALSQGIANLGTSWSHKYEQLFHEYGVSELLINPNSSEDELIALMDKLINNNDEVLTVMGNNAAKYKNTTEKMWQKVVSVVDE